jgi:hypothetical protein
MLSTSRASEEPRAKRKEQKACAETEQPVLKQRAEAEASALSSYALWPFPLLVTVVPSLPFSAKAIASDYRIDADGATRTFLLAHAAALKKIRPNRMRVNQSIQKIAVFRLRLRLPGPSTLVDASAQEKCFGGSRLEIQICESRQRFIVTPR